jgi:shikimate 5-dehydrogenase
VIAMTAAEQPTLYFIGVTTGQSSIMKVFPAWAEFLGLAGAQIKGIDFPVHAAPAAYREAVAFIKNDPLSLGALVTTHKIDLFDACRDLFDEIDPHAALMGETSCLSKRDGHLICHAKDPISSGLTLDAFLPAQHFETTGAELFVMGAGGSCIALTWHLMQINRGLDRPSRIIVADRNAARLEEIARLHTLFNPHFAVQYRHVRDAHDNDQILSDLSPGALVINATGLGKDAPGSPLSSRAVFPQRGIAWELNYRGELVFLEQARHQQQACQLHIEDGWNYFIHGWTQVIAEVFDTAIAPNGEQFEALSQIAARFSQR